MADKVETIDDAQFTYVDVPAESWSQVAPYQACLVSKLDDGEPSFPSLEITIHKKLVHQDRPKEITVEICGEEANASIHLTEAQFIALAQWFQDNKDLGV
jgi:hypothetical protein